MLVVSLAFFDLSREEGKMRFFPPSRFRSLRHSLDLRRQRAGAGFQEITDLLLGGPNDVQPEPERLLEGHRAFHRFSGEASHFLPLSAVLRQLVDSLLADHRRVHIEADNVGPPDYLRRLCRIFRLICTPSNGRKVIRVRETFRASPKQMISRACIYLSHLLHWSCCAPRQSCRSACRSRAALPLARSSTRSPPRRSPKSQPSSATRC